MILRLLRDQLTAKDLTLSNEPKASNYTQHVLRAKNTISQVVI